MSFLVCYHLAEEERLKSLFLYFNCVFCCSVAVCLFLEIPWVGLWSVVVAFFGHTHMLLNEEVPMTKTMAT